MGYTIGSFNLQKFDMTSNDTTHKNLDKIAEIIKEEQFDVIALQEIKANDRYVGLLAKRIGFATWKSSVLRTSQNSRYHDYEEGYAYLWNSKRLNLIGEPEIYNGYGGGNRLVRPPMVARFTPKNLIGGLSFELRLINTHIAFNKPKTTAFLSEIEYRREEFRVLTEEVYPRIAKHRFGSFMPAYTILMGDYNMCILGTSKIAPDNINAGKGYYESRSALDGGILVTNQSQKTTLKMPKRKDGNPGSSYVSGSRASDMELESNSAEIYENGDMYSQDYDHFTFDVSYKEIGISEPERVDALKDYYNNDLALYRKEISDHVPIKIILDFKSGLAIKRAARLLGAAKKVPGIDKVVKKAATKVVVKAGAKIMGKEQKDKKKNQDGGEDDEE